MADSSFLHIFRQAAPYIHAHRDKTVVIAFYGDINRAQQKILLQDCALLHALRVRLVLVHGARAQIDAHLQRAGFDSAFVNAKRVTSKAMMPHILDAVGSLRLRIEAALSVSSPMQDTSVKVAGGNFLTARPVGVIDGVDFGFAGLIRHIDTEAIRKHLDSGEIVLLSPLGNSPTGEIYNLSSEEVASEVALALQADKLIYILDGVNGYKAAGLPRQLAPREAEGIAHDDAWIVQSLKMAARACEQGIRRVHLLERDEEGSLLSELFTRDGSGIMVTTDRYDNLRQATINDIGGLLALIRPLEAQGVLVKRSREQLEMEIARFFVLERDGAIIGCAALYPYPDELAAELACVVIHPEYRKNQRADLLLSALEAKAREQGVENLFILTTQTAQWFEERGFVAIGIEDLPVAKQQAYNYQRNSRPYLKKLS